MKRISIYLSIVLMAVLLIACQHTRQTIIIDDMERSQEELAKLDSAEIFSTTVWAPGMAPERYRAYSKTTITLVKTRRVEEALQRQRHSLLNRWLDSADRGMEILFIKNGMLYEKESQKSLRKLVPSQLSYADTMEYNEAKALYGSYARPVSLIIGTYKPD